MKSKTLSWFATLSLLLFPILPLANEASNATKSYPPYPDVWGYDLSEGDAGPTDSDYLEAYKMENGDYWFTSERVAVNDNLERHINFAKNEYATLIKFFEREKKSFNHSEVKSLEDQMKVKNKIDSTVINQKITFSNGDTLSLMRQSLGKLCHLDSLIDNYYIKHDKNGKELGRYSIIEAGPKAQAIEDLNQSFEECGPSSSENKIHTQLYFVPGTLVKLEDDTFILFDSRNLMVRFDQNLKTKYDSEVWYKTRDGRLLKRKLIVVPYQIIEDLMSNLQETEQPISQGVQDGVMNYILKNK